ncbi:MAG: hypothetical protein ABR604_02270 [Jatrophihabitantaceae bacterium]
MHAVVFQVDFKPEWRGDIDAELDQLVGFMKSTPGYIRGTWTSNGSQGLSFLVFDSESAARAVADNARMPQDASVTLRSAVVYEIARDI